MKCLRIVLIAALALGAAGTAAGQLTLTFGQPVYFTASTYNVIVPYWITGGAGDLLNVGFSGVNISSTDYTQPPNPAAPIQAGTVWGIVTAPGATLSGGVMDMDTGFMATASLSLSFPPIQSVQLPTINDPIAVATGELFDASIPPDLALGGPLPLEFRRSYGSLLNTANGVASRLGNNWVHNFEWLLTVNGPYA